MNLHHLEVFEAVAREGSISRAGERLMVSQPAVSKQLGLLEAAVGVRLVERAPRGVRLTAAGEVLAGYARRIFALAGEAEQALEALQGLRRGKLRVGASTTIGIYYLPELLATYRRKYPQIEVELEVGNTTAIQQALVEHRVDIGLTEGFVHSAELVAEVFMEDDLLPIVPAGHALAGKRRVGLEAFCREPLLMREAGSGTREVVERALVERGVVVKPLMTLGSTEAIKRSVAAGVGVAFVSGLTVREEVADGRLAVVRLEGPPIQRSLHVVRGKWGLSAAAGAFVGLLPGGKGNRAPGKADGDREV